MDPVCLKCSANLEGVRDDTKNLLFLYCSTTYTITVTTIQMNYEWKFQCNSIIGIF